MVRLPHGAASSTSIVGTRGFIGLGGGLLVLVLVAASAAWQAENNAAALQRTARTQSLRSIVSNILISAQDAETGQRGYLLTQNPSYLAPFEDAKRQLPAQVAHLQDELPGRPELARLRQAATSKLAELQQTIDLASTGHAAEATALVSTNQGLEDMRQIRAAVAIIAAWLDAQLASEADAIRAGGHRLVVIDGIALLLVILLAALIAVGVRAYLADLAVARQAARDAYDALQTHNDQLDEAVRKRTADLTAANEEIQRFAYIVSHDLRAPLVNIMGFTSELEHAANVLARFTTGAALSSLAAPFAGSLATAPGTILPDDVREAAVEEIPEALRFIKASTSKMDRLINAILKLSREGRRVLNAEHLDMHAIVENLVDTMGHQAQSVAVSIGALPDIQADRIATEQVFGNLIDNALKYLAPERAGEISVTGGVEGVTARYNVRDNGRGIDERDFERVFELFRRAGSQTVPGDGIGLAHVRALVRRMGGSIECASHLGEGTTFTVCLPLVAQYA